MLLLLLCSLQIGFNVVAFKSPLNRFSNPRLPTIFRKYGWREKINTYPRPCKFPLLNTRGGEQFSDDYNYYENDNEGSVLSIPNIITDQTKQLLVPLITVISKTPPVTRLYLTASFVCTLLSFLVLGNRFPGVLLLDWPAVIKLQLWRPLTSFLYFGPFGINFLLTIQFIWQYMSQVEKLHYARPEKFVMLMAFGSASLLLSYFFLGISTQYLGHNLSTYLVYIWSKMFEGMSVNMMGLLTLPAEMLPWFFCAQTFVVDGMFPVADLLGILIGHIYLYFEKNQLLEPPDALTELFARESIRKEYMRYKGDFE